MSANDINRISRAADDLAAAGSAPRVIREVRAKFRSFADVDNHEFTSTDDISRGLADLAADIENQTGRMASVTERIGRFFNGKT